MTISLAYERYLSHFQGTVTLRDFNKQAEVPGLCALRHDVDHDLDLALEMAHREHQLGFKASYFILPSAPYWGADKRFLDKCLQLQDYGHEVGLHINSLAEWVSGATSDIRASLAQQLHLLRNSGIDLTGIAAHGDKLCYEHNLSNYWCFKELRPDDPYVAENGRTAEGPYEADMTPRLLYPQDHVAHRPDGQTFDLWSISMSSLGLEYHAWHTKFDRYFSDSSGGWKRTPDPIQSTRGPERWQVLIHPEHWRGPKKYYFFLSSARSGSKWLSEVLSEATPLKARHEYVLNQPFHRGETSRKATSDVWALEDNPEEVKTRLIEAWEEFEDQPRDFAEVNVYLENFAPQTQSIFPEAVFVQLKREPALVISSLMDRNWYDTPEDRRHPRLLNVNTSAITQFERVCHYVAQVDKRLSEICAHCIYLEELTRSPESLALALKEIGIPYHPRLGNDLVGRISNARKERSFPDPHNWEPHLKNKLEVILAGVEYAEAGISAPNNLNSGSRPVKFIKAWISKITGNNASSGFVLDASAASRIFPKFCRVQFLGSQIGLKVIPDASTSNTYLAIGGSSWEQAMPLALLKSGWRVQPRRYIKGSITIEASNDTSLTIYALSYNQSGKQIHRRNLGVIDEAHSNVEFALTPHPNAATLDFIVYLPAKFKSTPFTIKSFMFKWISTN